MNKIVAEIKTLVIVAQVVFVKFSKSFRVYLAMNSPCSWQENYSMKSRF